jgi:predicted ArsR family transcriptional regulator
MMLQVADLLFRYPFLTVQQAADALGVTYNAAKKNFGKLVKEGILEQVAGPIRPKVFLAQGIQEIVETEM